MGASCDQDGLMARGGLARLKRSSADQDDSLTLSVALFSGQESRYSGLWAGGGRTSAILI